MRLRLVRPGLECDVEELDFPGVGGGEGEPEGLVAGEDVGGVEAPEGELAGAILVLGDVKRRNVPLQQLLLHDGVEEGLWARARKAQPDQPVKGHLPEGHETLPHGEPQKLVPHHKLSQSHVVETRSQHAFAGAVLDVEGFVAVGFAERLEGGRIGFFKGLMALAGQVGTLAGGDPELV